MHEMGASDLHLASGNQPLLRLKGRIEKIRYPVLDNTELKKMLYEIAPEEKVKIFEETGDVDFGYEIPTIARYRANFFNQKWGVGAVFREIPTVIPTVEELGLSPVIGKLASLPKGLVLVTGPTGSGKSTTLATIIDHANRTRNDHILTIEDPVEFVHKSNKCLVNHREIHTHTRSFASALRGALREDPDIIMVGELRDLETIALALEAANTGHLVMGTLHTTSASSTIDRIIDIFPANEQAQIRASLADALRAVIAQTLFRRADQQGRVAAQEILLATPAVRNLIREHKIHQIATTIQTGRKFGMQSMDDALLDHLLAGRITPNDAYTFCVEKTKFRQYLTSSPEDFTDV
jgi:twitching motility protein PilT